ncbi:MAG: 5-deoxy-glucuronate isomerase [Atribacterota bacterium]
MIHFPKTAYPKNWLYPVADETNSPLKNMRFYLFHLPANQTSSFVFEQGETAFVLLSGQARAWIGGTLLGETGYRENVFKERASCFYFPPHVPFTVEAIHDTEWAIFEAFTSKTGQPRFISKEEVQAKEVGKENFTRIVYTIIGPEFPAQTLMVGETLNRPGCWSSFPPHRHQKNRPPEEYALEEVYHYRFHPQHGFGVQCLYLESKEIEDAYLIKDGDTFVIPGGYHPVVAAPGYALYYCWALAGENRVLKPFEDPPHRWVGE